MATSSFVRKSTTESVTSSTTLQNDDELLLAIGANETWVYKFELLCDGATAGDLKVAVVAPSGASGWYARQSINSADTAENDYVSALVEEDISTPTGLACGMVGTGTTLRVLVKALVVNGATPGNVQLQWAQNSSSGTATRVLADSYLLAHKDD